MKVYEIIVASNTYQSFDKQDAKVRLDFDCIPLADTWVPPKVIVLYPKLKRGDFWGFAPGALVTSPQATERVRHLLEMAGELLPLPYKAETFTVTNILECVGCLDEEKTQWEIRNGSKLRIVKYVFHPDRFSESTLFKIPEQSISYKFCVEGIKDPEDEFKYFVESRGLNGLKFKEVWDSEKP